eukprot:jgi/Ulvmu1/8659/UM046_0064.1
MKCVQHHTSSSRLGHSRTMQQDMLVDEGQSRIPTLVTMDTDENGATIVTVGGSISVLPAFLVNRSQLLSDLAQHADSTSAAALPISDSGMLLWLHHAQSMADAPGWQAAVTGSVTDVESSKQLLQAADILIDEATKADMCSSLAASLTLPPASTQHDTAERALGPGQHGIDPHHIASNAQVFAGLSDDLALAILKFVPLAASLAALPPELHPLTLSAHAPAIHSSFTLTLPPLPANLLSAATTAAAALPTLRSVSLAGHVLAQHDASLTHVLCALPALTALSLADCGLRGACGRALDAALPRLPHLQSLDLSSNHLSHAARDAVSSGLRTLPALSELRLENTVTYDAPDHMHALAAAVAHLPALATLSIGSLSTQDQFSWGSRFTHALIDLLRVLCDAPVLTSLNFHFGHGMSVADTAETATLWKTLGGLRKLRKLSVAMPVVKLSSTEKGVWESALGSSLGSLTQLTELDLSMHEVAHRVSQPPYAAVIVAPLATLTALRRLRVPQHALTDGLSRSADGHAVLESVLCLPGLTSVHISANRRLPGVRHARNAAAADDAVVGVLRAATQLQSLRMPLHMCAHHNPATLPALLAMRSAGDAAAGEHWHRMPRLHELAMQLSFASSDDQALPAAQQLGLLAPFSPLLRATDCLDMMGVGALWLTPLLHDMSMLRGLTRLRLTVLRPNSTSFAAYTAFLGQLSALGALRELAIRLHTSPSAGRSAAPAIESLPVFCEQLPALTALSSLALSLEPEGFDAVSAACAAHGGLRSLDILTQAAHCTSLPVGALRTLRSLAVSAEGIAGAENFWAELPRLTTLRYLRVHGTLNGARLSRLAEVAREALPALRELHVTGLPSALSCVLSQDDLPCMFVSTQ